jgi:hypothetical protein
VFKAFSSGRVHECVCVLDVVSLLSRLFWQLGYSSYSDIYSPPSGNALAGVEFIAESVGPFTCVITTTKGVRCWGYNAFGQVGLYLCLFIPCVEPLSSCSSAMVARRTEVLQLVMCLQMLPHCLLAPGMFALSCYQPLFAAGETMRMVRFVLTAMCVACCC